MLFNSVEFIFLFLPISWITVAIAARYLSNSAVVGLLLVHSIAFYAYWKPTDIPVLMTSMIFNFLVGRAMCCEQRDPFRRLYLWLGIIPNLLALFAYKYYGFFMGSAKQLASLDFDVIQLDLPLGISFFTFTQTAFLVDVYRRRTQEQDFLRYGLFVTLFPHLIAGPILHQSEMSPQFKSSLCGRPNSLYVGTGLAMFCMGLAKKVLLADPVASIATPVFSAAAAGTPVTFWEAWAGALAYSLQIYFDFSGYSDMAIGIALLFGIRLPINFNSPYKALSIIDFWRRWHITLSAFLRDYLYIPLGGNRRGITRRYINLIVTMLLGGLWHGANWTFIFWGAGHGTCLAVGHWLGVTGQRLTSHVGGRVVARVAIFILVTVLWVPFRADTIQGALHLYGIMMGANGMPLPHALAVTIGGEPGGMFGNGLISQADIWLLDVCGLQIDRTAAALATMLALVAVCIFAPNSQEIAGYSAEKGPTGTMIFGNALREVAFGACLSISFVSAVMLLSRPSTFLYFNF